MKNRSLVKIMFFVTVGFLFSQKVYAVELSNLRTNTPIHQWWLQCKGNEPESTCLSDSELSKFKTICADRSYREDCRAVVEHSVAIARANEGRAFLKRGFVSQVANYQNYKTYLHDIEKIWDTDRINKAGSFAVGILPACNPAGKKNLIFSKNLRPEVKELQNEFLKVYQSLAALPCPSIKEGFVLVTIGRVHDKENDFEVFTLNENNDFKVIRTAIPPDPFGRGINLVTHIGRPE